MNKKRQHDEVDNSDTMMALLKRLHLDKTSELYEKPACTRSSSVKNSSKRWRLSTIKEYDGEVSYKRRRIDSEIANELSNSLYITDNSESAAANKSACKKPKSEHLANNSFSSTKPKSEDIKPVQVRVEEEGSDRGTSMTDDDLPNTSSKSLSIKLNVSLDDLSLENEFIKSKLKESSMQLVLWTPSSVDLLTAGSGLAKKQEDDEELSSMDVG